jgi:hypothetical protein
MKMCKNECDDSEAAFKRVVKKVAKAKPEKANAGKI